MIKKISVILIAVIIVTLATVDAPEKSKAIRFSPSSDFTGKIK